MAPDTSTSSQKKNVQKAKPKLRKAPQAPKRFKSAFIFFSQVKHPEIRATLTKNEISDVPNVAKLVSKAWKELSPKDRSVWTDKAVNDKKRYEMERQMYTGPWKVPSLKETKKHPDAPKRPMSTFLAYSQDMRKQVRTENPKCSSTEISKLLAVKWKQASDEEKKSYIEQELKQRKIYKIEKAAWNEKTEKALHDPRKKRQEVAQEAVRRGLVSIPTEIYPNPDVYPSHDKSSTHPQNIGHPPRPNPAGDIVSGSFGDTMYGNMYHGSHNNPDYMHGEGVRLQPSSMHDQNHNRYGYPMQNTYGSSQYGVRNMAVNEHESMHYHPETSHPPQLRYNGNHYTEGFEYGHPSESQYPPQVSTAPDGRWHRQEYTQPQTSPYHGDNYCGTNDSYMQQNPMINHAGLTSSNTRERYGSYSHNLNGHALPAP